MKRFVVLAVSAMAVLSLSACGDAAKEKAMQDQIDSCTKDKTTAQASAKEMQAKIDDLTKQLDAAKAAAAATPTPAATPAKGATKPPAKKTK